MQAIGCTHRMATAKVTVFACVGRCVCVRALASSNLKSCKDHVDDIHPIDLYTFISVNVEDGSFHLHGIPPYTCCKPQNLGYECSAFSC